MPDLQIIVVLILIVVLLLLALLLRHQVAVKLALSAIRPKPISYGAVLTQEVNRNHVDPALMDLKYEKLFLKNKREQELTARLYLAPSQTDRYILFLHAYNYPWVGVLKYLPMLRDLGFNILVPDQQAQGESQGDFITFGALESDDSLEWLGEIRRYAQLSGFERARIGVMGESMGAVTALLTMAKANSPSVKMEDKPLFCVADCPFSNFDSLMELRAEKHGGKNALRLLPLVKSIIKSRSGADMDEVNTVKAAAAIRVPVLLFHGTDDPLVPASMSQEIAAANPNIKLCLIEGAKHINCYATDPKEYRRQFVELLKQVQFENETSEEFAVYL